MPTDTTEKELESLIMRHMTGTDGLFSGTGDVVAESSSYGGTGGLWVVHGTTIANMWWITCIYLPFFYPPSRTNMRSSASVIARGKMGVQTLIIDFKKKQRRNQAIVNNQGPTPFSYYAFDQMSDFLAHRTDDDFGVKWEIHPCYREALDIKKLNRSHRVRFERLRKERGY